MSVHLEYLQLAAQLIKDADGLIITAGAGIGIDSGLPDFRGNDGFWQAYPGLRTHELSFREIANGERFLDNSLLAWGFYGHRLNLYRDTMPHAGFGILLNWLVNKNLGFVFTSNVDGQFQKAGFTDFPIIECHGSIHYFQCARNCNDDVWPANGYIPEVNELECLLINTPPRCPHCGGIARPNIMMFDDWHFNGKRTAQQTASYPLHRKEMNNPVVIELGAGGVIPTVRFFSERMRCPLIRINPDCNTSINKQIIGLPGGALDVLQQLSELID